MRSEQIWLQCLSQIETHLFPGSREPKYRWFQNPTDYHSCFSYSLLCPLNLWLSAKKIARGKKKQTSKKILSPSPPTLNQNDLIWSPLNPSKVSLKSYWPRAALFSCRRLGGGGGASLLKQAQLLPWTQLELSRPRSSVTRQQTVSPRQRTHWNPVCSGCLRAF